MKNYSKKIIIINILTVLIFMLILINYYGKRYLNRLNKFITENNRLIVKKEINNFIISNKIDDSKKLYKLIYDDNKNVTSAELNINYINYYLSDYIKSFNDHLKNSLYNELTKDYFKSIKTKNNTYLLVPIGIIYDNPFLFNVGPNIILHYDYISSITFNVELDISDYGLNNILVNIYLNLDVEQSALKPILDTTNKYNYRFLISSNIVYGKVSDYVGTNITSKSSPVTIK